ncbi:MAG: tetratricopeptide repeat protein [Chloroflexi bacterium]|nr:tetratricopeptide repeat protein [Chloroflexota bacterium]MBP8056549.1 tetratricopeptide repeat protein [Chloroflexota bacterium]
MLRFFFAYLIYYYGGMHRFIGNRFNYREAHRRAVRFFSLAYRIDKSYRKARLDRGVLYWRELGKMKEALADFDALLRDDPTYTQALFNRAMAYQDCGRYPDAVRDLENFLTLASPSEDDYYLAAQRSILLLKSLLAE